MAFSEAQIAAAVTATKVFMPEDVPPIAAYLFGAYGVQRDAIVAAYYDTLIDQIRGQVSQDILARAANLAATAADSLLESVSAADIKAIGAKISEGLAAGKNARDIARTLEEIQGLDANRAATFEKFRAELETGNLTDAQIAAAEEREYQRLLRDRRETIARTEGRKAVSEGDMLEARTGGARYKVWQSQRDERVSDDCQDNEDAGPIPIDDVFPGGVDTPPQHPNCRCSVAYITSAELLPDIEAASREWAAETAEAKS